jgi:hypothetical protein
MESASAAAPTRRRRASCAPDRDVVGVVSSRKDGTSLRRGRNLARWPSAGAQRGLPLCTIQALASRRHVGRRRGESAVSMGNRHSGESRAHADGECRNHANAAAANRFKCGYRDAHQSLRSQLSLHPTANCEES